MIQINKLITYIIIINGIYDLVCALSILIIPYKVPFFSNIHMSMIIDKKKVKVNNYMAYWILTYGIMRLYDLNMAFFSYLIEAICFSNEIIHGRLRIDKGLFTIIVSLLLALYIHIIK